MLALVNMTRNSGIPSNAPLEEIVEHIRYLSEKNPDPDQTNLNQINRAYNILYQRIQEHPRLAQPRSHQFEGLYQEIKDDAMQRLFVYLRQDNNLLKKFKPDKALLIQWVNFLLIHRFFPETTRQLTLPMTVGRKIPDGLRRADLDTADWQTLADQKLEAPSLSDKVRDCLQSDPTGEFEKTYIDQHPEANFQRIRVRLFSGNRLRHQKSFRIFKLTGMIALEFIEFVERPIFIEITTGA